ncbi:MAG: DEAD/DEAH box helicase [Acetobacteraceae bacterium]
MTEFSQFGLAEPILSAVREAGYDTPTPIQTQTIPLAMAGRDIVGIAQTGTGKTAAFTLPLLHRLAQAPRRPERRTARILVLSPTRELAAQIEDSVRTYGKRLRVTTALVIGGVSMGRQVRALANGVDVLIATPGRLLDLVAEGAARLDHVEALVLDEADQMLDMGFLPDVRRIIAKTPQKRQTLLFSATMPEAIAELSAAMLNDPARVAVTPVAKTADRVAQRLIHVDRGAKPGALVELLAEEKPSRVLVFTRTKHGADKVVRDLERAGIAAGAIHGNKSQGQRERALAAFRDGEAPILVATDIAARGIDVSGVSHVVNYDLPNVPETYVHRIGRTARAGAEGIAISLCDGDEVPFLRDIEKLIRQQIPSTDRRTEPAGPPRPILQRQQRGQRPQGSPQHVKPLRAPRDEAGRSERPRGGQAAAARSTAPRAPHASRGERHAEPPRSAPQRTGHPQPANDRAPRPAARRPEPRAASDTAARHAPPRGAASDAGASLAGLGFLSTRRRAPR